MLERRAQALVKESLNAAALTDLVHTLQVEQFDAFPIQVLERRAQALVKESSDMAALALDRQVEAERLAGEQQYCTLPAALCLSSALVSAVR